MPRYKESARNLTLEQVARNDGYDAGYHSQEYGAVNDNPYTGYRLATAWEDGFHEGRDDQYYDYDDVEGR